jgi:hypothetical protein
MPTSTENESRAVPSDSRRATADRNDRRQDRHLSPTCCQKQTTFRVLLRLMFVSYLLVHYRLYCTVKSCFATHFTTMIESPCGLYVQMQKRHSHG